MFGRKPHTINIMDQLKTDLENHNFSKCQDEWCPTCNYKLDEIVQEMKLDLLKSKRFRLPKSWSLLLQKYFPKKMVLRALTRYSHNEIYKKVNYNHIVCQCQTKNHDECDGIKMIQLKNGTKSIQCPCKKHLRKQVKGKGGEVYL